MKNNLLRMIWCVHVDDVIVVGQSDACNSLHTVYGVGGGVSKGNSSGYSGARSRLSQKGVGVRRVSQRACIEIAVNRFGAEVESGIPASQSADFGPRRENDKLSDKPIRTAIGSLLWVSGMARPDISQCRTGSSKASPQITRLTAIGIRYR